MTWYVVSGAILMCAIGAAAFFRPHRVILRSAIAAGCAIAFPFVMAFVLQPLLGDGAGMGVAAILVACSTIVLLAALAAAIGAGAHHLWKAMRG